MSETIEQIRARVKQAQKNYQNNLKSIENILVSERGYASRAPQNEDVVVLMSGGLDSSVMVHKMIDDWNVNVYPLFIQRGAKAEKLEEQAFDYFVDFYKRKFPTKFFEPIKLNYQVPPKEVKYNFPTAFAKTIGHPLRNSSMQNLAVMYAVSLQTQGIRAKTIFSGSVAEDNTEPELGLLSLRSQTLATCIQMADWQWNITSPLTDPCLVERPLGKKEAIEYALQKFIPLEKTRSCFSENSQACGTCTACVKRLAAFENATVHDNITYKGEKLEK